MQTAPPSCLRQPHYTHYWKGQDPVHSCFNLWPLSNPSFCPGRQPMLITITVFRHGGGTPSEPSKVMEPFSPTSLLAPNLATYLETKLGEILS